jgi:UDP-N-acetylglucosamine 2-epimerase (non-hydrolysing)
MKGIATVLGMGSEAIKMSPVVRACERRGDVDWFMGPTGQERSWDVGRVYSGGLGLPDARYNPDVGSGVREAGGQSEMMARAGMEVWEGDTCQTRL